MKLHFFRQTRLIRFIHLKYNSKARRLRLNINACVVLQKLREASEIVD